MDLRNSKRRNPALLLFTMSVVSNLGSLIHPLPPELRKQVRDLEKVSFRRCKSDCSLLFNSVCVKENLLPTYSNIYIYIYIGVGWQQSFTHTNLVENHTARTTNTFERASLITSDFRFRKLRQREDQLAQDWEGHGDIKQTDVSHFEVNPLFSFPDVSIASYHLPEVYLTFCLK